MSSLAAAIVSYHPPAGLDARARLVAAAVERLYIVDNGSPGWPALAASLADPRIECIGLGENRGQAAALNVALEQAAAEGHTHLLLLDQDSGATPEFLGAMRNVWVKTRDRANLAVLAPVTHDAPARRRRAPSGRDAGDGLREIDSAITSGCVIDVALARRIGAFREELFIDWVDHEFCFRVRRAGLSVLLTADVVLEHTIGMPQRRFGMASSGHAPLRRYFQFRNRVWFLREYWRCFAWHERAQQGVACLLSFLWMGLIETPRLPHLHMACRGLADGWRGSLGPFRE